MKALSLSRIAPVTAALLLVFASACQNPAAEDKDTDNNNSPGVTDSSKIGFEGSLKVADYTYTNGDHATGDEAMTFSADTATFKTGAQSLKVQGTSLENQWAKPNCHAELILPVGSVTDFTGKTVTAEVYLPAGSAVTGVNLTFIDAADKVWMVNTEAVVTAGQWNAVSFTASDKGYATLDDVTSVSKLRIRFLTGQASASVSANIDSINW